MSSNKAINKVIKEFDFQSIAGVVRKGDDLYATTPEARDLLIAKLKQLGYLTTNHYQQMLNGVSNDFHMAGKNWASKPSKTGRGLASRISMEQSGEPMWSAELAYEFKGKCGSCKKLINPMTIDWNGHKCEFCGAVTYYLITQGCRIRARFINPNEGDHQWSDFRLDAYRWFPSTGDLYCYKPVMTGSVLKKDATLKYFNSHSDKWKIVNRFGKDLILLKYKTGPLGVDRKVSDVQIFEFSKHYVNYEIVVSWKGGEYKDTKSIPWPLKLNIYEAWHWQGGIDSQFKLLKKSRNVF